MNAWAALNFGLLMTLVTSTACAVAVDVTLQIRIRTMAALAVILVNNLSSNDRCARLAFHLTSIEWRIAAARPCLRHVKFPGAVKVNQCEIGITTLKQTPGFHFHDPLWIDRKQLHQPSGFEPKLRQCQANRGLKACDAERCAVEFQHF